MLTFSSLRDTKWVCHLYWHDGFGLFREDHPSIEEWRHYVVNQEMNSGLVLLIKLLVIVDLLHSSTAQHPVNFPRLVILATINDFYYTLCVTRRKEKKKTREKDQA